MKLLKIRNFGLRISAIKMESLALGSLVAEMIGLEVMLGLCTFERSQYLGHIGPVLCSCLVVTLSIYWLFLSFFTQ